jgi:hypothetical protein
LKTSQLNLSGWLCATLSAVILVSSAHAATNLILNGSFEAAGTSGVNSFTDWTKLNDPAVDPATVIPYNSIAAYPNGAYTESIPPNNSITQSPDPVGSFAAYFVGDNSVNESLKQSTYLVPGNYRIGFSYYLPANGLSNPNNAEINASIIGIPIASASITGSSLGQTWMSVSGVGRITLEGYYSTSLVFSSGANPAKDVVVDQVYAISTTDPYTIEIPPTPDGVPEPGSSVLFGVAATLFLFRRRNR